MRRKWCLAAALLGLALASAPAQAAIKLPAIFTDNMVLQRGIKIPIWGAAEDGEQVTVRIQAQEKSLEATTTAKDGKWMVRLDPLKAGGPYELTVAGSNTLTLKNVLVGEVWVCSGQSNMQQSVAGAADPQKTASESANSNIRLFTVNIGNGVPSLTPRSDLIKTTGWKECGPDTVKDFSAVGYFFGRDIQKALEVPVGLINTSWGGTVAEAWTSRDALEAHPDLKYMLANLEKAKENFPETEKAYKAAVEKRNEAIAKAKADGKKPPPPLFPLLTPENNPNSPTALYNSMIAPLIPFGIHGAIWYQGESNAGRAFEYRTLFRVMIENWRKDWKQGDFPFLFVQLAPWEPQPGIPAKDTWPELREAQLLTSQKVPHTAMAVITDAGDKVDIHPKAKQPVGARLALAALALAYGRQVEYAGPVYDKMEVDGSKAVLSFKHVGGGLVAKGGKLQGFTVAGEDRKFVPADAEIVDGRVVVSSSQVEKPVAVRFGWHNYPEVNLFNKEGLPASPFRTDDFPMVTNPKAAPAQR